MELEHERRAIHGPISEEYERRMHMWKELADKNDPINVPATTIRYLRIYGGRRGIFRDMGVTGRFTPNGTGITVGLLHTGRHYPDDLSQDGMIYHYPETEITGWDLAEIEATKKAGEYSLPVFSVISQDADASTRQVRIGWVAGWDDNSRIFLISFEKSPPPLILPAVNDEEPFVLTERADARRTVATIRKGQQAFKLKVFQRYGPKCCICGMSVKQLLVAAHIRPRMKNGSNHPQNGLVLCQNHHKALDDGLFVIKPETHEIACRKNGPDSRVLGIDKANIDHLARKPNDQALTWLWKEMAKVHEYR